MSGKATQVAATAAAAAAAADVEFIDNVVPYSTGLTGVDQPLNYLLVNIIIFSFVGLCIFTLIYRISRMAQSHLRHISTLGSSYQTLWSRNQSAWWPFIQRHIAYAPLWKNRHNREIQLSAAVNVGTIPSRYHTILLSLYFLSNVAYCFILDWSNEDKAAIVAELRGRAGVLAVVNLIPTVIFALRNNPLIPLLQVSYDTFNLLHRWTARITIIQALLHTLAWLVNSLNSVREDQMEHAMNVLTGTSSYTWGTVGTSAFLLIAIQAWSPVRHAFYETFLNVHRLLVVAGILGVYVHLDLHNLPHLPYVQAVVVLWGTEYILRVARIVYLNVGKRSMTKVTVEALPSEACRVTFDLARDVDIYPGSHVHAYLPTISLWSSHPFSVAWTRKYATSDPSTEKLPTSEVDLTNEDKNRVSISLIMRARTGMTRSLFDKASRTSNGTFSTWGAIEGPYGGHHSLRSYGTLLLFAGGVGITHQVSYVRDLVAGYQDGTVAARKIVLVWSIANTDSLEWVRPWMDEILRMPGRRDVLRVLLFITKPKSQAEIVSGTGTVQMFPGRCNPQTVLDREISERVGAMAVTVCGPGAFADGVRAAVRQRVHVGSIDFVEEAFTY